MLCHLVLQDPLQVDPVCVACVRTSIDLVGSRVLPITNRQVDVERVST